MEIQTDEDSAKKDQRPGLNQVTNQDQPLMKFSTAEDAQGSEPMDVDVDINTSTTSSPGNQHYIHQSSDSVITTQPGSTQTPNLEQTPSGQINDQDSGRAGPKGSDPGFLVAAQISSLSENQSAVTQGQQQDYPITGADQDPDLYTSGGWNLVPGPSDMSQMSPSASKSSDTRPKKREINLLNPTKDTADDDLNPSAPRDVAKVYMTVDWPEEIPQKWKFYLETALQTWCSQQHFNEQKCTVNEVQLLGDERTAEVEITPSTALNYMKTATLIFKQLDKSATVHFQKDKPKSLNKDFSPKGNMTVKEIIRPDHMKDAEAASNLPGHADIPGALTVPPFLYCYLSQTYRKELEQIENEFGVKINAETCVSISAKKADEKSESDSVIKATQAFTDLYLDKANNIKSVPVPQSHMESDVMKQVLQHIPDEENKILLNMSANNNLLFAPEHITSMVEKRLNLEPAKSPSYNNPHNTEMDTKQWRSSESSYLRQTLNNLDMDIKNAQAPVEMDETHWKLLNSVFVKQLQEIQNKYGVQFDAEPVKGSVKVSARSRGTHQVNLEAYALRALTHLYQKAVTSAVTCDLKDPSYIEIAQQIVSSQHSCVGGGESNGSWKLFGLPKYVIHAIADIEKVIGHTVFNEEIKLSLGYPLDFSQASGFQKGQMEMEEMRGAHGTDLRGGTKDSGFNQDFINRAKEDDKKKETEDNCSICLDTFIKKKKLGCGHEFCKECLEQSIKSTGEICPLCKKIFGILKGNQPGGEMSIKKRKYQPLSGFPDCGLIEITYDIPSGMQTSEHPNPGKPYSGAHRTAYLPDNPEGNHVLQLLRRAFDQKLIFTVGFSRTSGADNVVIWNDIHHKTNTHGGPERYGYPDPGYLKRVKEELKAKGIE